MLDYPLNYERISVALNVPDLERRLKAKSRARKLVDIRRALSAILYEQGYSVREIAREFCRPHSTVVHFVHSHRNLFTTDSDYQHLFHQVQTATEWR